MVSEEIWFSQRERIYSIVKGKIEWTDQKKIWNWDRCTVSLVRTPAYMEGSSTKKLRIVVRSNANQNQTSIKVNRPMNLRFMLGFDIEKVGEIKCEKPDPEMHSKRSSEIWTGPKERWIFQLDDDYWIWSWKEDGVELSSTNIYRLYQDICHHLSNPGTDSYDQRFRLEEKSTSDGIVLSHLRSADARNGRIVPVIYQPAVDGLKNFVREVHCNQKEIDNDISEVEVTLIFNDEELRDNSILDDTYRRFRAIRYNRTSDVETFKIRINRKDRSKSCFIFKNIYSIIDGKRFGLNQDSIHGDPDPDTDIEHEIAYYFVDYNHPIVFINTSNHAMAEHDANRELWKWEYVPGVMDSPVSLGSKSREKIDKEYVEVPHLLKEVKKTKHI